MKVKGRNLFVPPELLQEIDIVKKETGVLHATEAMRQIAKGHQNWKNFYFGKGAK